MSIFSQTWLVPFLYLAVMLGVFLFAPQARRAEIQNRMRAEPNLFLICNILLIPLSIWATLAWRQWWIDYFTWALLVFMLAYSIVQVLKPPPPKESEEPSPL